MVAKTSIDDRFVPPPGAVLSGQSRLVRFTREDAASLVRIGIIPEDASTELLDGFIVLTDRAARGEDVLRVGRGHRVCVERLSGLRSEIDNAERHVQSQQPLACSDTHEPQPDFMVVKGQLAELDEDGPFACDVYCVVEVADSSYERDIGDKLRGYARAGVAPYVVINLRNRTAEVYTNSNVDAGTYPPPQIVSAPDILSLRVGDAEFFDVPLRDILP